SLTAVGGIFTSINDNGVGVVSNISTGSPKKGDYQGIYALKDGDIIIRNCEIKYANFGLRKQANSTVEINNNFFHNNNEAISLTDSQNILISNSRFENNEIDIKFTRSFLTLRNNIFINTSKRILDSNQSPENFIYDNIFIGSNNDVDILYANAGEVIFERNNFTSFKTGLDLSNTSLIFKNNFVSEVDTFIRLFKNEENRDYKVIDNIFSNISTVFGLTEEPTSGYNLKAYFNYFLNTENVFSGNPLNQLDLRANYWGEHIPGKDENPLVLTRPFLFYGDFNNSVNLSDDDVLVRNYVRVKPGVNLSLNNVNITFFSEYIDAFVDIMKIGNSRAKLTMKECEILQSPSVSLKKIFDDSGFTFNPQWSGINLYGVLNATYNKISHAKNFVKAYNDHPDLIGASIEKLVFNEINLNTDYSEYGVYFVKRNSSLNVFNYDVDEFFFNRFYISNTGNQFAIAVEEGLDLPVEKLNLKFNYLGTNHAENEYNTIVNENFAEVFPYAVTGTISQDLIVKDHLSPLVAVEDLTVEARLSFECGTAEAKLLFATDSYLKGESGSFIGSVNENPLIISDISELSSPYSQYIDFNYWGGDFSEGKEAGLILDQDEYYHIIRNVKTRIHTVFGTQQSQKGGMLVFDNSRINIPETVGRNFNIETFELVFKECQLNFQDGKFIEISNTNGGGTVFRFENNIIDSQIQEDEFFKEGITGFARKNYPGSENMFKFGDRIRSVNIAGNTFYNFTGIKFSGIMYGNDIVIEENEFLNSGKNNAGAIFNFYLGKASGNGDIIFKNNSFGLTDKDGNFDQNTLCYQLIYLTNSDENAKKLIFENNKVYAPINNIGTDSAAFYIDSSNRDGLIFNATGNIFVSGDSGFDRYFRFENFISRVYFSNNIFIKEGIKDTIAVDTTTKIEKLVFNFNYVNSGSKPPLSLIN
ncbi:MAG: right-handed parallel beta-helix repeat-containing protein, partial [Candidatus Muiribacteriota bacterium]